MATNPSAAEHCAAVVMENVPPVMRFIRSEMRRQGSASLSVPQLRALGFLDRCPGTSLSAVAEHLGVTASTASTIADRLVRHGLVERTPHPEERRRIALSLTAAGAGLLEQARAATRARITDLLGELSPEELRTVEAGVTLLNDAVRATRVRRKREQFGAGGAGSMPWG
jgi:DNA-binding MarR family transcriptional regulator